MFERMPDVGKKAKQAQAQPNRTPLLLGALAGCLLLLICVAAVAVGGFILMGRGGPPSIGERIGGTPIAGPKAGQTPSGSGGSVRVALSVDRGATPGDKYVWLMNADGKDAKQVLTQASSPTFSPDGSQIAYYHWTDGIYVANVDGGNPTKIVGETNAKYLAWSHDGKWIAFSSQPPGLIEKGNVNIDAVRPDGSGRRTIVIGGSQPAWSPDDSLIYFTSCRGPDCGIFRASSLGGDPGTKVVGDLAANPALSPDGKRIAYQAEADGVKQLFIINADGTGKKQLTTGTIPRVGPQWSLDGGSIFYRSPEGGIWGIWKMNADGSNPVKLASDYQPVDWAYERLAVGK